MEGYLFWRLILQIFFIAYRGPVGYSHEVQKDLQYNPKNQPHRTAYHFQPPKNWMNGPMYYKGIYHLFYQYNPYSAVWGNISWGHSVSYNLVDWIHIEQAINPTEPYDINGCWSGSASILPGGNPVILYTGSDFRNRQVQNIAVPKNLSDPYLREWIKSDHNPLMTPMNGIDPQFFRDPTTAWEGPDKIWRVVVGSQIKGHGTALLYQSRDFVKWTRSHRPLHFSNKTAMWECPDFYPVSVDGINGLDTSVQGTGTKHVLKASFNDRDYYIIGTYEPETDTFSVNPDFMDSNVKLRYDYGIFYASKTFYDSAKRRRILWGWVLEADGEPDDVNKGWSGLQSLPRSIFLDKTGKQLSQWPIEEIETLRRKEVNLQNKEIKGGTMFEITGITASQADIEVSFHLRNLDEAELMHPEWLDPQFLCSEKNAATGGVIGPFGILALASKDLTEHTAVFFRVFRGHDSYVVLMCSDQNRSSLREEVNKSAFGAFVDVNPVEKISLRSLIDHSIIESFGGEGKTCITARVYPKLAIGNESHVYVFNNGTESIRISNLSAWSMKRAQIFPLHKRRKPEID
ncbi:beta-fructofuranosidase, insoluble isoenzyme CWINV1 isoform X2 [Coffea arabica]|uniref:Beta-fructofuranosidase, insoluble isoenzyme CWINV1 isoform X2 n=1 Tax=Coffea arabica TaxID=13443 RepID=A0ABM4VFH9_COFAR